MLTSLTENKKTFFSTTTRNYNSTTLGRKKPTRNSKTRKKTILLKLAFSVISVDRFKSTLDTVEEKN